MSSSSGPMTSGAISGVRAVTLWMGEVSEGRVEAGDLLDQVGEQGEEGPADHEPDPTPQASDDRHDDEDERQVEVPRIRRHEAIVVGDQRSGQAGEHARDDEGEQRRQAHIDAERRRHPWVLAERQQRPAALLRIIRQSRYSTTARKARHR